MAAMRCCAATPHSLVRGLNPPGVVMIPKPAIRACREGTPGFDLERVTVERVTGIEPA